MKTDAAVGSEGAKVGVFLGAGETIVGKTVWTCEKWSEEACDYVRSHLGLDKALRVCASELRRIVGPAEELVVVEGNLLLNEGIQALLDLGIGAGGTAFNNANARIGVGDSTTAEAASQTDLQAAANKTYKAMNATYPQRAAQTLTFQSDFGSTDANYAWNEWVIDNGAAAAKTLNRKVASLGTKATGTWTMSGSISLS